MKNSKIAIVASLGLLLAAFSSMAAEPVYRTGVMVNYGGTLTNLAGATATNVLAAMDVSGQKTVAVSITQGSSVPAATDNLIYFFQRSVDGQNWDGRAGQEEGSQTISVALAAFTKTTITNLDTYGCGFIRLAWITNAGATTTGVTNLTVSYALKAYQSQ